MSTLVVTGGGRGIGWAVARRMLLEQPPTSCAILDTTGGDTSRLIDEFGNDRVRLFTCDVADQVAVGEAVDGIVAWKPPIRYLVNSAGNHHRAPSLEHSFEDWRRVLSVHLDGTFLVSQRVGQHMAAQGGGAIVNLGSVAMFVGWQGRIAYAAAKAAVGAVTRTLAVEWAEHRIRVNAVAPGYTDTPFVQEVVREGYIDADEARALHAFGRFATADEVAEVIVFLLSERSSFVTGTVLPVDGGFLVKKLR